jgi:translation initiation factor 3 subunit L
MSQQRMALWAAEEIDEDLQDVDLSLAIGNYGQNGQYDDGGSPPSFERCNSSDRVLLVHLSQPQIDEATLLAMQQHIAQQTAFAQIPDAVKTVNVCILLPLQHI